MSPIVWFKFKSIGGKRWKVLIATPDEDKDLLDEKGNPLLGVTVFENRKILINAAFEPDEFYVTLWHELAHLALGNLEVPYFIEEPMAEALGQEFAYLLSQFGVQIPAPPEDYKVLSERYHAARKV